jgi:hypothetical protein
MRRLTPDQFRAELEQRRCKFQKAAANGYTYYISPGGEPFSVPPPEELDDGDKRYPDWMLDDLINHVGLPAEKGPPN